MTEWANLLPPFGAGMLLGAVFFGGLWWTVQRGAVSKQPSVLFLGSALLRTFVVLAGFYLVSGPRWERFAFCLGGFLLARLAVTWLIRLPGEGASHSPQEAGHAPHSR